MVAARRLDQPLHRGRSASALVICSLGVVERDLGSHNLNAAEEAMHGDVIIVWRQGDS